MNMNLQEPKKKKRVKLKPQSPFPIPLNEMQEWPVYTAHLTDMGSCIVEPEEINAVHSMGFFGKGSLSRSYPSFGKARYGVPPIVRNRQWLRRQKWLEEVKEVNSASTSDYEDAKYIETRNQSEKENTSDNEEENNDVIEIIPSNFVENRSKERNEVITEDIEIDEVTLDSAEEDDVCVIVSKDSEKYDTEDFSIIPDDNTKCTEKKESEGELCDLDYYDFKNNCTDDDQHGKLLVLPDSDSDTENYLKDIEPRIENEGFPVREALHLTFEETFFLLFGLGCLQLVHFNGNFLDINNAWLYFCKNKSDFLQKYIVYHYYRSNGWIVKPGLKYGGDFLLYKEGPPFYHASYIVIVEVVDADSLVVDPTMSTRSMMWDTLFGLERLSETAAKEILFAQVLWPSSVPRNVSATSPEILSEFTVRELLWRRWNPKQHREDVPTEEEDEDSC